MFAVVSLDRLVAVAFPFSYLGFKKWFGWGLTGGAYAAGILYVCVGIGQSVAAHIRAPVYKYQWTCSSLWVMQPDFLVHYAFCGVLFGSLSILLYVVLLCIHWLRNKLHTVSAVNPAVGESEAVQRQKRITKTVGVSCLLTLIFDVCPRFAIWYIRDRIPATPTFFTVVLMFSAIFIRANSLAQPFILYYRLDEIKTAVRKLACVQRILRRNPAAVQAAINEAGGAEEARAGAPAQEVNDLVLPPLRGASAYLNRLADSGGRQLPGAVRTSVL